MPTDTTPIWPGAWRLYKANFGLFACLSLINTTIEAATGWSYALGIIALSIVGVFVTGAVAAYAVHVSELTDQKFGASDLWSGAALPNRAFVSITLLVIFAFCLVGLALWPLGAYAESSDAIELTVADQMMIGIILASLLAYVFFLCRFGTVFPAAAIDNDWSLKHAYDRGRGTSWTLAKGLLAGPIPGLILLFILYWFVADVLRIDTYIWREEGTFSSVGVVSAFIGNLISFLITCLGVVAFCNAYRRSKFGSA